MTSKQQLDGLLDDVEARWTAVASQNVEILRQVVDSADSGASWASLIDTWFQLPTAMIAEYGVCVSDWRHAFREPPAVRVVDGETFSFACEEDAEMCMPGVGQ